MEKRKISKYRNFAAQLALSESVLYMSPELNDILDKIGSRWDSQIAKDLSNAIGTDIKPDVTFLDLSDKEGEITFTTMRNAKRKLDDIYRNDPEFVDRIENLEKADIGMSKQFWAKSAAKVIKNDPEFWKAARNPIRVGKLVRQVLPGKYSDAEIEKFVNQYKSAVSPVSEMLLVQGNDIEKYYWHENYASMDGDLGNSCMAKKKGIFGIYTNNPEVCKLLVMLDGYGKAKGRALVWKVGKNKEGIEWFMDRQYWNEQHDVDTFRAYAKEKGWAYKTNNNHYDQKVTWQDTNKYIELSVSLKEIDGSYEYGKYPYMDTFKRYDPTDGTLYNDDSEDDNEGQYLLQQTNGDYTEIESGVWSEWHDRTIPRDEAVWSEPYDDWLRENSAVYIEGRGYYHEDDTSLVYCEWDGGSMHEDDCVYSDDTSEWINKDRAVRGVYEIDEDGDIKTSWYDERDDNLLEINQGMRWYQVMKSKNTQWRDVEKIHSNISEKWANRNAIDIGRAAFPSIFKRFVYSLSGISDNPRLPKEYMREFLESGTQLSIKDCKMLGFEYVKEADSDPEDLWIVDDFEYHKRLSEAGPEGDSLLSRMIDLLVNDLIPNAEKMPDDGDEDMVQTYKDRLDRIWGMMPDEYQG